MESLADREHLREYREQHQLITEQRQEAGDQQRVDVEANAADAQRARDQQCGEDEASDEQRKARVEKQPTRAEQQHEAQVPPAIAPRAQMGWPRAAIWMQ